MATTPTPSRIINDHLFQALGLAPDQDWAKRHTIGWGMGAKRVDAVLRDLIIAWARYGEFHQGRYGQRIGDDGVLGEAWKAQGHALLTLLNGERGDLDGGTLDKLIRDIAATCGVVLE